MSESPDRRCGFVAVIGAPNAGKSTLINKLVGAKVSIVSQKIQTTRSITRGITIHKDSQIIFIDTPGIFTPKRKLDKAMVNAAWDGESSADIIVLLIDAAKSKIDENTRSIINKLAEKKNARRIILALNKIDKTKPENLLALTKELNDIMSFSSTYMISALKADGLEALLDDLANNLPEGEWHYPEDQISDLPMRLLAAEITREKIFERLHQEIPYGITVETENWEDRDDESVKIDQVIYVSRQSFKKIVLGKGGSQIKAIGKAARLELEKILETRVHIKLFVKFREGWQEDPERYRIWGLDYPE